MRGFQSRILALIAMAVVLTIPKAEATTLAEVRDTISSFAQDGGLSSIFGDFLRADFSEGADNEAYDPLNPESFENVGTDDGEPEPMTLSSLGDFVPDTIPKWAEKVSRAAREYPMKQLGGSMNKLLKGIESQKNKVMALAPAVDSPLARNLLDALTSDESPIREAMSSLDFASAVKTVTENLRAMLVDVEAGEDMSITQGFVDLLPESFIADARQKMASIPDLVMQSTNGADKRLLETMQRANRSLSSFDSDKDGFEHAKTGSAEQWTDRTPRPGIAITFGMSVDMLRWCQNKMDDRAECKPKVDNPESGAADTDMLKLTAAQADIFADVGSLTLVIPFTGPVYGIFGTGWGASVGGSPWGKILTYDMRTGLAIPDSEPVGERSHLKFFPEIRNSSVWDILKDMSQDLFGDFTVQFFFNHFDAPGAMWNLNVDWHLEAGGTHIGTPDREEAGYDPDGDWVRRGEGTSSRLEWVPVPRRQNTIGDENVHGTMYSMRNFVNGITLGLANHCSHPSDWGAAIKSFGINLNWYEFRKAYLKDRALIQSINGRTWNPSNIHNVELAKANYPRGSPYRKMIDMKMNVGFSWGWGLAFPDHQTPISFCEHEPVWINAFFCVSDKQANRNLNALCNKGVDDPIYPIECECHHLSDLGRTRCNANHKCKWHGDAEDGIKCRSAYGNRPPSALTEYRHWYSKWRKNEQGYKSRTKDGQGWYCPLPCREEGHSRDENYECNRPFGRRRLRGSSVQEVLSSKRQTRSVTDVSTEFAARMVLSYLENGELLQDLCIGKGNHCTKKDDVRSISGTFVARMHEKLGAELRLSAPIIKAGAIAYLAASPVSNSVAEGILQALQDVGVADLGVADASLSLSTNGNSITLTGAGSPLVGSDCSGFFQCQIQNAAGHIKLQNTATYHIGSGTEFETRFGTDPIVIRQNKFAIRDTQGLGPSFFTRTIYSAGTTRQEVGATLGLDICVEACSSETEMRNLNLEGEMLIAQTAAATTLSGELSMNGWWTEALGAKMVHIGDIKARLGIEMKTVPPVPTEIELGAQVCLGRSDVCMGEESSGNFIRGLAYGGLSATDPGQNYLLAMLSETTMDKIFAILGDTLDARYHSWRGSLPPALMQSGLYPTKTDCTSEQMLSPALYPECFSRVAVAPVRAHAVRTSEGIITVPKGFSLSGRINIAGFEAQVDAAISSTSFKIDAEMDPISLGGFLDITASAEDTNNDGPRLLVDLQAAPATALVEISGRVEIPPLSVNGDVFITVNEEGFRFVSSVVLFGYLDASLEASWGQDAKENPQIGFSAQVEVGSLSGAANYVKDAILGKINEATAFLDRIEEEKNEAANAVNDICKTLKDKNKISNVVYTACRGFGAISGGVVRGSFATLEATLEGAKVAIEALITAATNGITQSENFISIQSIRAHGNIDGSFSSTRVGTRFEYTVLGQQRSSGVWVDFSDASGLGTYVGLRLWNYVKLHAADIADLGNAAEAEWQRVANAVDDLLDDMAREIIDMATDVGGAIVDTAETVGNGIANTATNVGKGIKKKMRRF